MKDAVIVGSGGLAIEVAPMYGPGTKTVSFEDFEKDVKEHGFGRWKDCVVLAVGDPDLRKEWADKLLALQPKLPIDKQLWRSCSCIDAGATVGDFCYLGMGVVISHETKVGDFCTICHGTVVCGKCVLGERVFVGANATILPKLTIGDGAVIGAGAVVTQDVAPGNIVAGNPAKVIRNKYEKE